MSDSTELKAQFGSRMTALLGAYDRGDGRAFLSILDDMLHARKPELFGELRELTCNLQVALDRFRIDARLADLAEKDIPDARLRLAHVLKMTDEAAHRTLDLVEKSGPLAERTARSAAQLAAVWTRFRSRQIELRAFHELLTGMDAFLPGAQADCELIRRNLAEVLLTQGYQDLTGQIIRGVMQLVAELESALSELTRLSGAATAPAQAATPAARGHGPAVPGVTEGTFAAGQQDVDALLSGLGV